MGYYICDCCKFQFTRTSAPDRCPDCGKLAVRAATPEEIQQYLNIQAELQAER